jgi:antitoxin component of RelBE/YafQ-DinJ toxin-antitoxin module
MTTMHLTLKLDEELLSRAQKLAVSRGMTVSEMLERLVRVMAQPAPRTDELPPATRAASGLLPPMDDEQVERVLDDERTRKFEQR